ncbi:flagellar biosynthetic protein FliR [Rhodocyclus tenuis]|uniref:Flagellar biosynthetic protein FliR n=1 Tax=Rhodocyclus gracilis TaxID=2929842 RepID=A0ABX0WHE7_9RHOO|nr:flagellar biosynthetic protein FliR [Rhodocyclus gracilis]MRD73079.1 flagellar biosynthetic protein FliR [Rhodocyclus gracilis]NJA89143.1 flagellar biosynthetic protein FliR [Rhodocyclus gracilis]
MISFTTAELNAWIVAFFFPLARVLALMAAAPPFNNKALTRRVRIVLAIAITLAIAPALPKIPPIDPASGTGLWILAEQLLIGYAMGFALRVTFAAVDMAGNLISMQMGLGFATSFDPQSAGQTPVLSEFLSLLAILVFMSINGHLLVLATLTQSFTVLPIAQALPGAGSWLNIANSGMVVFSSGLMLALPIIVALLITNIALGVLTRAAPQLNLFAVGFPITLSLGFGMLIIGLSYMAGPLQALFEFGMRSMLGYFVPAGA